MKRYVGLSEKRMLNKRFRKTEEAILAVFFKNDDVCMNELARRIGVARSTVHNHHRTIRGILPDYEKYILGKYKRMIRKIITNKNLKLKMLYFRILFFMVQEKKIFEMLIRNERRILIEKMLNDVKLKIIDHMKLPKNSEKIFMIYVSEVAKLIEDWGKRGFIEEEIEKLLLEIMYLTDTGRTRLSSLLGK